MRVAISLPDDLFDAADHLAEQMGLSRNELYVLAVAEYVAKHRHGDVTDALNQVYSVEPSGIERTLRSAQAQSGGGSEHGKDDDIEAETI